MTPKFPQKRALDYNSPQRITSWLEGMLKYAVENEVVTPEQAAEMRPVGDAMIADGQWRGNISEKLVTMPGGNALRRHGLLYL